MKIEILYELLRRTAWWNGKVSNNLNKLCGIKTKSKTDLTSSRLKTITDKDHYLLHSFKFSSFIEHNMKFWRECLRLVSHSVFVVRDVEFSGVCWHIFYLFYRLYFNEEETLLLSELSHSSRWFLFVSTSLIPKGIIIFLLILPVISAFSFSIERTGKDIFCNCKM